MAPLYRLYASLENLRDTSTAFEGKREDTGCHLPKIEADIRKTVNAFHRWVRGIRAHDWRVFIAVATADTNRGYERDEKNSNQPY